MTFPSERDESSPLGDAFHSALEYVAVGQRIVALIRSCAHVADDIALLYEEDQALRPELAAALARVGEAAEALNRAHTFALTRSDLVIERAQEGGGS